MKKPRHVIHCVVPSILAIVLFQPVTQAQSEQGVPVFQITPVTSKITFHVNASVSIEGIFEKWDSTITFTSADVSSGHVDIKIQADSVNTGSKSKDDRLKGEDCFDAKEYPYITFRSAKIIPTGSHTFDVPGTFTIRGVSKAESLTFTADREGQGTGEIEGTLWFDRRDFDLGGSIPFVRIADRVELAIDFKASRISGPALLFKQ
jgi:polyisoprenoid-binding protein YceI